MRKSMRIHEKNPKHKSMRKIQNTTMRIYEKIQNTTMRKIHEKNP
jgi:hypothetical protein